MLQQLNFLAVSVTLICQMSMTTDQMQALYADHGPALMAFVRRRVPGQTAADDCLQETFTRAFARQDQLLAASSARSWLIGIARNVVRESARTVRMAEHGVVDAAAPDTTVADQETEEIARMREAIDHLPEPQREALELRVMHELSYEQIAEATAAPIGTVRSRLHQAMRGLRALLTGDKE